MQQIENGMVVGAQKAWDDMCEGYPLLEARFVCCECECCICEGEKYQEVDGGKHKCLACVMDEMLMA